MRKAKSEHHLSGKSGLILIGTIILLTFMIILSYIWETQHTFRLRLGDINWTQITIHLTASFLIGIIALFLLRLSETKRRKTMEILQEGKNRAQNYLDIADVILVAIDAEQKVSFINKKGCEILGYKQDEVTGKNWFENFLPKQVRGEVNAIYKKLMTGEIEPVEFAENLVLTRSGNEKIIAWHNTLLKDEAGKIIGTLSSGEDITELKKAEEMILSLSKFPLENPNPILRIDEKGEILYRNPSVGDLLEATGLSEKEIFKLLPENLKKLIADGLKTGKPLSELEVNVKDRIYSYTVVPIVENKYVNLYGRDITERKKAEQALRESEKKHRTLLENLPQLIFLKDKNSVYVSANKNYCKSLGIKPEEIKGKTDFDFYPKELAQKYRKDDWEVMRTGKTKEVTEEYIEKKEKKIVQTVKTPVLGNDGKPIGVLGIFWDITERKKVEEALKESEQRYRALFEGSAEGILVADIQTKEFKYANPAICRMLGYTEDGLKQMSVADIHPKEELEYVISEFETQAREEKILTENIPCLRKDGRIIYVDISTTKVTIDGRKCNVGFFKDISERKRIEEVFKESENYLKTLLDSIHTGILVIDPETHNIIDANLHAIQMIGVPKDQLIGHTCHKYLCPEEEGKCPITDLKQRVNCSEKVLLKANKEKISILKSVVPITRKGRNYLIESFIDISNLKKAEEALRTSEAQLSNAMKIAKLGYWEYDVSKDLFTFNDNFYAIFRTSAERVGGYTMPSSRYAQLFVHPEDMQVVGIETRKAIETTDPHFSRQLEHRIIYANGETGYIAVRFFIIKDSQGRTVKTFGANQDITERKRIEEALRESEEKYRLLIENQGEGIATADLYENFIFVNPAAEKIFGVPKGGLVGRNLKEFTSPEQFQFIQEQTKKRYKGEKDSYEIEIINVKGEKRFLLLTAAPWFDKDGKLISTFGIFRDITERKQLQQQLIQSEKLAAVGTLAYGIAHEFNNILAGMLANAELGLITDDAKQIEKCFNIIAENSYRASSITRNLLAFSSNKEAKKELIDITEPLRSVLAITRRELEKLNIGIVEKFKPVPKICCDAGQLSEVFLNMITNARDAMRAKGGKLTIQVERVRENIQIIFEDTGCGIPEKLKGKIFAPFVTTKGALGGSEIPGTGLGLFLSYGIIEGYKGRIEVESETGKGTKFTITIPVSKNLPCESIRDTRIESSEKLKRKLKILLVDDEKAISFGLKKFLESRGHQVTASLKAEEGLEHFEKGKFDLVLSDIAMPDMDGIELIKKIKEKNRETKVIAITGHILKEKEDKAREAGADEVLIKPFKNEVLYLAISKLVAGEV